MKKLILVMTIVLLCSMAFAWDLIRQTAFPTNFYCLEKIGNTYWAGGCVGAVAKSTDNGLTWRFVETPAYNASANNYKDVWDIDFINDTRRYRDWETDRKSTRLNSSHITRSRMPSSA